MTSSLLETFGKYAGIGGLALGVFLLLFRDLIRRLLLPQLTREQAFHIIKMILWLVFGIAALGILAWLASLYITAPKQVEAKSPLPQFSAAFNAQGDLVITNSGGPAFNVARDSNSSLTYFIPQELRTGEPETSLGRIHHEPNANGVGSLGGDTSWFRIDHDKLSKAKSVYCDYLRSKGLDILRSRMHFELNVLHQYDDSFGQSHKRSWRARLSSDCAPQIAPKREVYEGNASNFRGHSEGCAAFLPEDMEGIRQLVLAVLDGTHKCL